MARPLSAARLLQVLRKEGLHVVEYKSWRTHNRNSKGHWGPVHGVMLHHTVTQGTNFSVSMCYRGHAKLPGPLCHGVIAKNGTVYLVGNGRVNHAGTGDRDVLRAVIKEARLPHDNQKNVDGNRYFYGFECINLGNGRDPWPAAQLEAAEMAAAAVCRAHGWTQSSVIGHLEWQPGKSDPRGFTMWSMRQRIKDRLQSGPTSHDREPAPIDDDEDEDDDDFDFEPFPGDDFFRFGRSSPIITAMGRRLVEEGCGCYPTDPGPRWSGAARDSFAAWQRKLGYAGRFAEGRPSQESWDELDIPAV